MSEFIKTSRFDILLIALDTAKRAGAGVELSELGVVALVEEIATLQSRIAELEAERRWIPVSEGLPEDCERVWVSATNSPHNLPRRAFHTYRNGKWVNDEVDIDNVYSNLNVTHWMPLPTQPEVQEWIKLT